jgi:hypothetical protein
VKHQDGDGARAIPERDPLADLVSRSVGARVESVDAEVLASDAGIERKRLRFRTSAGTSSAIFERRPRGQTLEAQLLPFLARKTPHVPVVHSRGLPPPHAQPGPWLLMEDILGAPVACDGDAVDVLRAKLAIERATSGDVPALRALGLRQPEFAAPLSSAPLRLVHGDLRCAMAHRTGRGVVIVDWSNAYLGPAALDAASLIADALRQSHPESASRMRSTYVQESGDEDATEMLAAAEALIGGR